MRVFETPIMYFIWLFTSISTLTQFNRIRLRGFITNSLFMVFSVVLFSTYIYYIYIITHDNILFYSLSLVEFTTVVNISLEYMKANYGFKDNRTHVLLQSILRFPG